MEAIRLHATFTEDGEIVLEGLPFKKGQRVELLLLAEGSPAPEEPHMTARQLLESPLIGLWEHRDDIGDSAAFARRLREQAEHRGHS